MPKSIDHLPSLVIYQKIKSGDITFEQFDTFLQSKEYKSRYENTNRLLHSYIQEFASRKLVYVPKVETEPSIELVIIAREILKQYGKE